MTNHFRTLILNLPPVATPGAHEEYVPPTFTPVRMGSQAAAIYQAIFQYPYPRAYRNFIATLLTRVVYNAGFATKILRGIDRRVTFPLCGEPAPQLLTKTTIARNLNASALSVSGDFEPNPARGIFDVQWSIQYSAPNVLQISNLTEGPSWTADAVFTGDASGPIGLGYGLSARFTGVTATPGILANVSVSGPMSYDVNAMFGRLQSSPDALAIFAAPGVSDPSLIDLFNHSSRRDLSLAAILTAYCLNLTASL